MILVRLDRVTYGFGARTLFEDIAWRVSDDARIGLVGRNGSGKSTLLRLLGGQIEPERGSRVALPRLRVGLLDQEVVPDAEETTLEFARTAFREHLALLERAEAARSELEARTDADPQTLEALAHEIGHLHDHFARAGGHAIESRIEETLEGLGIARALWERPLRTLSGGEKGRAAIARLLLAAPDLLLLDEPTNHLDMAATEWLEAFLASSRDPFVIVSHDRTLLDRVATSIVEIEHERLEEHPGTYSDFARIKRARIAQEQRRYELALKERERQEEFIRRNIAGQKTKQAQSRRKRLEREGPLERPLGAVEGAAAFDRIESSRSGSHVIAARGLTMSYPGRPLFERLSLDVLRGDRLGIVGGNGAGKTTLLRVLQGELRGPSGTVEWGTGVHAASLDQEGRDLDPDTAVLDTLWDLRPTTLELEVRGFLGGFLFRGDDVFRKVGTLSGGERTRLALARIVWSAPNLIFLDEPTNHLDIASREALEAALGAYDGTLVVASHDRYFLDALATQILWLGGGEARAYRGNYSEARAKRLAEAATAPAAALGSPPPSRPAVDRAASTTRAAGAAAVAPARRESPAEASAAKEERLRARAERDRAERERRRRDRARARLESEITALEERLTQLTAAMEDESARGDSAALREAGERYASTREELAALYARWAKLVD